MKKRKFLTLILSGVLSMTLLGGCLDDELDEETEYEEELDSEDEADDGSSGSADLQAYGEAGVDDGSLQLGSGLDVGEMTMELDANPTRAVRRSVTPINQTVNTMLDGTPLPEDFYLYRNALSSEYQRAYDQICKGLMNGDSSIVMSVPVSKDDICYVYWSVTCDHPELFWVSAKVNFNYNNNGIVTEVFPQYYQGSPSSYNADVESSVGQALADMWSLGSDIEKVKYAHDYLTNTIDYTHNDMDQSAYSGFVWKQTVCAGYARCFAYMMHKNGIPCAVLAGWANNEAHMWNLLVLDGEYYVMDVTWDDPIGNPANTYYYNYFNITDNEIAKDHSRGGNCEDISLSLPLAGGTAYSFQNYFGGSAYGTNFDAIDGQTPAQADYDDYGDQDSDEYDSDYDDSDYDDYDDSDDQGSYDDYDDDSSGYYEYSDYGDDSGWWNMLDSSWSQDDWTYDDEGYWYIYDEDTGFIYLYVEEDEAFGAMTEDQETIYWLDNDTGEWVEQ